MFKRLLKKLTKKNNLKNTDFLIMSFPKCGRTWLKLLITRFLQLNYGLELNKKILEPIHLTELYSSIPVIKFDHGLFGNPLEMTPDELKDFKFDFTDKKIIILVREPKDVLISSYFHKKFRNEFSGDVNYNKSLTEFLTEGKSVLDVFLKYYQKFYNCKNKARKILLIRYEDFHDKPHLELTKICEFIGIKEINQNNIKKAVEFSSFNNMHMMEKTNEFNTSVLQPGDEQNPESFKTRRGKVGGYIDYMTSDEIEFINKKIRENLPSWYGYN